MKIPSIKTHVIQHLLGDTGFGWSQRVTAHSIETMKIWS